MSLRRLPAAIAIAIASLVVATACSGGGSDDNGGAGSRSGGSGSARSSAASDTSASVLDKALGRFSGEAVGDSLQAEFGDASRLAELTAKQSATWSGLQSTGSSAILEGYDYASQLAIKLSAADYAVSVGQAPGVVTLVAGGQDASAVTSAAKSLGYSGGDVLSQDMNVSKLITVGINQVEATGQDVVLAGSGADLGLVDAKGTTLADDDDIAALSDCLGDPAAAYLSDVDDHRVGLGVADDDGAAVSTICVKADDGSAAKTLAADVKQELASGTVAGGTAYTEMFTDSKVSVVAGDVVKATLTNADGTEANTVFTMLAQGDLPGV